MGKYIIYGRIPSKKNSRRIIVNRGRVRNIPSKDYYEWHEQASKQLSKIKPIKKYPIEISYVFFMPDDRVTDTSNKVESIQDLLVDCGIIVNDSWQYLKDYHVYCKGIDKENPRVEICIVSE